MDEARTASEVALADARERGAAFAFCTSTGILALIAFRSGDMRECEAHARTAIEFPEVPLFARPTIYALLALSLIERGELDEAESAIEGGYISQYLPVLVQLPTLLGDSHAVID
jgi:hypothetical protein